MTVNMPYGDVLLTSKESAADFVKNHCQSCSYNNQMSPCSGETSQKCNAQVDAVIKHFKHHDK